MAIGIVIPFYKNRQQLDKCLLHLRAQTLPVEPYVHDNSDDNIYFTAAVNKGLHHFMNLHDRSEHIIILNQDMYLENDAVKEMVKFMDHTPDCGIGMPLQLSVENPNFVIFAGGVQAFPIGTVAVGPVDTFKENRQIRWGSGACLILRKSMIQEIGFLDENMKLVGSDSDFCFTARSRGWQIWNIIKARGVHEGGVSVECYGSIELNLIKANDMDYYARKWLTGELYRQLTHPLVDCRKETVDGQLSYIREVRAKLETMPLDYDIKEMEKIQNDMVCPDESRLRGAEVPV